MIDAAMNDEKDKLFGLLEKLEVLKEDRKDDRVKKQSAEQSKLISQRQGERGELTEEQENNTAEQIINQITDGAG